MKTIPNENKEIPAAPLGSKTTKNRKDFDRMIDPRKSEAGIPCQTNGNDMIRAPFPPDMLRKPRERDVKSSASLCTRTDALRICATSLVEQGANSLSL